jgi:hypothetical protein
MKIRGLALKEGVTLEDIDRRMNLVQRYDTAFGEFAKEDKILSGMDEFGQKAYAMMRSPAARAAFDLSKENDSITSLFGGDQFSQSCLLATRLIESGVKFVTVNLGGWDTHYDNFNTLKTKTCRCSTRIERALPRAVAERTARIDRCLCDGRIWAHAEDQPARRTGSLSARNVLPAGRRRAQGRPGRGASDEKAKAP